ncbi:MAG: CARDB domain-containing protein [Dehalococcoidia bacterium]
MSIIYNINQMSRIKLSFLLAALCLVFPAFQACSPSLSNVVLTTQVDQTGRAQNEATSFTIDMPRIICSVNVGGLPASSEVHAQWLYLDNQTWKAFHEESYNVASSSYLTFAVNAPDAGWQTGDYAVRILVDGKEITEKRFTIEKNTGTALPVISSFTATPSEVTLGQPLTLSWQVSGASRVVITPDVGNVATGGSQLVSPKADTAYIVTALNSGGTSSSSINVKVTAPVTEHADLFIINVFRQVSMVYYVVGNAGTATSKPSSAKMYVGPSVVTSGYIPPLAPGEQRTLSFGSFVWSYLSTTPVTVCVDTENENNEANRDNNCMNQLLAGVRTQY